MIDYPSKISLFHFFSAHNGLSLTQIVSDTFLCMRLNHLRGHTPPVVMGMDDSQGTIKVISNLHKTVEKNRSVSISSALPLGYL